VAVVRGLHSSTCGQKYFPFFFFWTLRSHVGPWHTPEIRWELPRVSFFFLDIPPLRSSSLTRNFLAGTVDGFSPVFPLAFSSPLSFPWLRGLSVRLYHGSRYIHAFFFYLLLYRLLNGDLFSGAFLTGGCDLLRAPPPPISFRPFP